jgi:hypothetical protein
VQWFHAVDVSILVGTQGKAASREPSAESSAYSSFAQVPKRKPKFMPSKSTGDAKPTQPKKFAAFSAEDSAAIETAYQGKLEELEEERGQIKGNGSPRAGNKRPRATSTDGEPAADSTASNTTVAVNEDFLFDVNIEDRELSPVYWEGPVYDVRRGSWFYQEGSALRPCEENLAAQLEEGYLKVKPWQYPPRARSNSAPKPLSSKTSVDSLKPKGNLSGCRGSFQERSTCASASATDTPSLRRLHEQRCDLP